MTETILNRMTLPVLQGWQAPGSFDLSAAFLRAEGWAMARTEAFPDTAHLKQRLEELTESWRGRGRLCLDLRGLRGSVDQVLAAAREAGVAFVLHTADLSVDPEVLRRSAIPRVAVVCTVEEAKRAQHGGASALLADSRDVASLQALGLPVLASVNDLAEARVAMESGAVGLQPRSPGLLEDPSLAPFAARLMHGLPEAERYALHRGPKALPGLRIRHLELPYPIIQGGMGVGVSWEGLAGAVASEGCVGIVSAIGTGYHPSAQVPRIQGRPRGSAALNPPEVLGHIIREARRRSSGRGAVGVNILCAIEGYEAAVRSSVEAGAQMIISGAGLPLALPEFVGDAEVALVPIISSARALSILCKQWKRKYSRLPDAVVLEGPESGGHQGYSPEQCVDPAFALEAILPEVLAERDKWGDFPVLAAGGIWDHSDITRFLAMGASGVQMATRFIGTFECDAHPRFKDTLLQAEADDIVLMKSPVGMPARGVRTRLQTRVAEGNAPELRCVSQCLQPCGHGRGALEAGYCIADRLADARAGDLENGLFFSGSNGSRLKELLSVRDLVEELTQDPGLSRRGC
jgi:nitronate monooxygenase